MSKYTSKKEKFFLLCTCANKHDIILSILCFDSVYNQLGELVVHICPHHDGSPTYRVHWVVHGWVHPGEGDDIIGKVLGRVKTSKCLTGALRMRHEMADRYILKISHRKHDFMIYVKTHSARARVGHPALKRHPLVGGSISVGVRTKENPPDVCHVVHTHCWAFKDVTVEENRERNIQSESEWEKKRKV